VTPLAAETKDLIKPELFDCRDACARALEEMAQADGRVAIVINDSLSSAKMKDFRSKYPDRFINVGIAEQNMIGVGNGLANGGMIPYLCGASSFLTARALEQIRVDLAYSKANVRICGMSSGIAYGQGISEFWQMVIKGTVIILAVAIDQLQTRVQARLLPLLLSAGAGDDRCGS
jgi:transketolase C-terminal domain/subunit